MGSVHAISRPVEILTLGLSGEAFALEAGIVSEILDLVPVTAVPNAPDHAPGLINVRGKVVPLVDLRVFLGMARNDDTIDTRIIVVETVLDGEPTIIGLLADKVYEVTEIDMQAIETTPKVGMTWPTEFIRGIGHRNGGDFLIVLDMDAIFASAQ
ncbi:MAG TPA: chemotaxis protein CheW [Candidatus Sulfotelmatobacter sp.]|jgi:purine-binding chemotaxis protein CheW|nr:chemotaxis protein CheW [Candidatus Sulfotelmatobacter sp.]